MLEGIYLLILGTIAVYAVKVSSGVVLALVKLVILTFIVTVLLQAFDIHLVTMITDLIDGTVTL